MKINLELKKQIEKINAREYLVEEYLFRKMINRERKKSNKEFENERNFI